MRIKQRILSGIRYSISFSAVAAVATLAVKPARGQWTQWGGPHRDFSVKAQGLADHWPDTGPKQLWIRDLGEGYATIVSNGAALYTMYRKDQDEYTIALDARTGKTLWEYKNPSPTTPLMEQYGAGPHATPLLVGRRLYTIGTNAVMHCFDKATGKVLWRVDLHNDLGGRIPGRGYGCSPIAYRNTVIVAVDRQRKESDSDGDKKEPAKSRPVEPQTLVAFDQTSGSVVWKGGDYPATYSSPILIKFQGEEQLVQLVSKGIFAVNPANGTELWHLSLTPDGANLSTPLFNGEDLLFCSSAYDSGSRGIRLTKKDGKTVAEQLWYSRKMRMHHCDAIRIGDYVYGSSGDFGPAFYMGMNMKTGKVAWKDRGFKKANTIYADGKVILLDEDGQLALATVSPEGMKVHSKCTIAEPYAWAAPTLVGKTLYVRDRKHIMALDLG